MEQYKIIDTLETYQPSTGATRAPGKGPPSQGLIPAPPRVGK